MKNYSIFLKGTEMFLVGRDISANEELKSHINQWVNQNNHSGWFYNSISFFGEGKVMFKEEYKIETYRPIMGEDYLGASINVSSENLEIMENAICNFLDSFENSLTAEIRETS
jgi:hypothetical protein